MDVLGLLVGKGAMVAFLWHLTRMGSGTFGGIAPFLLMRFDNTEEGAEGKIAETAAENSGTDDSKADPAA